MASYYAHHLTQQSFYRANIKRNIKKPTKDIIDYGVWVLLPYRLLDYYYHMSVCRRDYARISVLNKRNRVINIYKDTVYLNFKKNKLLKIKENSIFFCSDWMLLPHNSQSYYSYPQTKSYYHRGVDSSGVFVYWVSKDAPVLFPDKTYPDAIKPINNACVISVIIN